MRTHLGMSAHLLRQPLDPDVTPRRPLSVATAWGRKPRLTDYGQRMKSLIVVLPLAYAGR
jgi:hypothetical protein